MFSASKRRFDFATRCSLANGAGAKLFLGSAVDLQKPLERSLAMRVQKCTISLLSMAAAVVGITGCGTGSGGSGNGPFGAATEIPLLKPFAGDGVFDFERAHDERKAAGDSDESIEKHHEDRHDPGDMSKCYVRLANNDGRLYFSVRMQEGLPDLNDPDLLAAAPVGVGSVESCDADAPAGDQWSEWTTFVFHRK